MTIQSWLIYLVLVIVATSTPGPAVLFVVTNTTLHGWKKSVFAAFGNIFGLFCLGIVSVVGLGAILKTSTLAFNTIKYIGAAYLIYIGIKLIFQKSSKLFNDENKLIATNISVKKVFLQAMGVALSNPKAIIFLTALFPQFINVNEKLIPQFSILIVTLMVLSFSFLMLYAFLAHTARSWLGQPSRVKAFNRTSGSVFVGFGVLLASASNK